MAVPQHIEYEFRHDATRLIQVRRNYDLYDASQACKDYWRARRTQGSMVLYFAALKMWETLAEV